MLIITRWHAPPPANLLGIFKILGVIALLPPGFPIPKEWGFTFPFIGAFVSHLAVNQNQEALMPLITMILLAIFYFTRPGKPARVKISKPKKCSARSILCSAA